MVESKVVVIYKRIYYVFYKNKKVIKVFDMEKGPKDSVSEDIIKRIEKDLK